MLMIAEGKFAINDAFLRNNFEMLLREGRQGVPSAQEFKDILHNPEENRVWHDLWWEKIDKALTDQHPTIVMQNEGTWDKNMLLRKEDTKAVSLFTTSASVLQWIQAYISHIRDVLAEQLGP